MAANTFQLMDALASPTAFGPNPHKWVNLSEEQQEQAECMRRRHRSSISRWVLI